MKTFARICIFIGCFSMGATGMAQSADELIGLLMRETLSQRQKTTELLFRESTRDFEHSLPTLIHALESQDEDIRSRVASIMAASVYSNAANSDLLKAHAAEVLDHLSDSNDQVREMLATAIASIVPYPSDAAVEKLAALLNDRDPKVRIVALGAVARSPVGLAKATDAAIQILRKEDSPPELKLVAVSVLATSQSNNSDIADLFIKLLDDPDIAVRAQGIRGLGMIGSRAAASLPRLKRIVSDSTQPEIVRRASQDAILEIEKAVRH